MLLAVPAIELWSTWEVWRALKKLELPSAIASGNSYASYVLSKLSAFSITRYGTLKHEPIVKLSNINNHIKSNEIRLTIKC